MSNKKKGAMIMENWKSKPTQSTTEIMYNENNWETVAENLKQIKHTLSTIME